MESKNADLIARDNYRDYAVYVNGTRAFASMGDGLKTVQQRIMYVCNQFSDIRKSVELCGAIAPYHPHGSCYGAIVTMANPTNNLPMFDIQGNFGGWNSGASADRYTGARLSKIAKFIYCQFIDYAEMIVGEIGKLEPKFLPCLIPYSLINGLSGIGVGMKPEIIQLDLMELIDYYIYYLENGSFNKNKPIIDKGSVIIDCERDEYNEIMSSHKGTFLLRSVIKQENENTFVVEALPGINIEKIVEDNRKLGKYINSEQVDYRDETKIFERYVFEINDMSCYESFKRDLERCTLKRVSFNSGYTDCSGSVGMTVFCNIDHLIEFQLNQLNKAIDKKIDLEKSELEKSIGFLSILKWFKDNRYFDDVTKKNREQQLDFMMSSSDTIRNELKIELDRDICLRIIRNNSIDKLLNDSVSNDEIDKLMSDLENLKNHDRKTYLISMYKELKTMVKPIYDSKKHSMLKSDAITSPRARIGGPRKRNELEIVGKGRGVRFKNYLVLIGENGGLYKHNISVVKNCMIDLPYDEEIVGVVGDECRYIELIANDGTGITFDMENYKYNKRVANLYEDQRIVEAIGYVEKDVTEDIKSRVRTKICRTMRR